MEVLDETSFYKSTRSTQYGHLPEARNTRSTSILSYSRTPIDRSTLDLAWYYYYFSTCMSWYLHAGTCADRTWFIMVLQPRLSKVPSYRIIEVYNKFSQVDLVLGT